MSSPGQSYAVRSFNSREHARNIPRSEADYGGHVSIPAHTGNMTSGCTGRSCGRFNSRTHGKHSRGSCGEVSAVISIPAHTGNIRRPACAPSDPCFNSRTHGKHYWHMVDRSKPRRFNSRAHGKHFPIHGDPLETLFQFPRTRETSEDLAGPGSGLVSIPAHTGNMPYCIDACVRFSFQFPRTRETLR